MRIYYVSRAVVPSPTSNSLSIMRVCQAFRDSGHDVVLSANHGCGSAREAFAYYGLPGGFQIRRFRLPAWISFQSVQKRAYAWWSNWNIRRFQPDLIYSRLCLDELETVPGDIPILYEMHSPGPVGKSDRDKRRFDRLLESKTFRRLIVTTNMLKDYLAERYPDMDIRLARLSAERPIELDPAEVTAFAQQRLQGTNDFRVGYTGYLDNYGLRGMDLICAIAERMQNIDFHIVGGPDEMAEYWRGQSRSPNLYFHGRQTPDLMPYYLQSFDVVLAPLQLQIDARAPFGKGMSPAKLPQYCSYGCAIVASDIPAHLEMLTHGEHAMLCKYDDVDAWVEAIETLRRDIAMRRQLGSNARDLYFRDHTPEIRIRKILADL